MADYTGRSKAISYLFQNGGGGGGSCKVISGYYHDGDFYEDQSYTQIITGDTECLYIDLDTTTLYLFDGTDYVEVQGGGGGTVSDGTVGVEISVSIGASSSVTYSFDDLGIVKKGYYLIACCSGHAETSGGWKWIGYMSYSAQQINYQTSYIKSIDYNNVSVTMNESGKTLTFANTNGSYGEVFKIQILPLHPKVEIPKHTYSTTEQVVGTWIDGKPIYEKTIDLGYLPNNGTNTINHGISDLGVVISIKGIAQNSTSGVAFSLPFISTTTLSNAIQLHANSTQIVVITGTDRSGFYGYATIQYTKTTQA